MVRRSAHVARVGRGGPEAEDVVTALVSMLETVIGHECSLASMARVAATWCDAVGLRRLDRRLVSAVIAEAVPTLSELVRETLAAHGGHSAVEVTFDTVRRLHAQPTAS
jgi:hypothetical protein